MLLCAPLVAGCGSANRVDFASHPRPATPLEISVDMDRSGSTFAPDTALYSSIRPGPVQFEISNQSPYAVRFSVRRDGRTIARTPVIAPGQPAQLQATLVGGGLTFNTKGSDARGSESSSVHLKLRGPLRTGDNDLTQP